MGLNDEPDVNPPPNVADSGNGGQKENDSLREKGERDEPEVLEYDGGRDNSGRRPSSTALNNLFLLHGNMEVGQPMEHWDYRGTQDDLDECVDDNIVYMPEAGPKRYYPALRTLIPLRFTPKNRKILPVDSVGFFSFSVFGWMTLPMWKLYRRGIYKFESYRCSVMESCSLNSQRFEYLWEKELKERGERDASLFRVSWRFIRTRVVVATLLYTIALMGGFFTPLVFLPRLVQIAESPQPAYLEGSLYAVSIFVVDVVRAILVSLHGAVYIRTGLRLRSAILTMVYRKVISMNTIGSNDAGKIMNLFSNDSARVIDFGQFLHMWVAGLLSVVVSFVWIIFELGWAGATGVITFLVFFFCQYGITSMTSRFRAKAVAVTDTRVQQTKEALSAIKIIKVNAWEDAFYKLISGTRRKELRFLQNVVFFHLLGGAISGSLPSAAAIITFMMCFVLGYYFTPAQGFAALAVLMWSRHGLIFIPVSLGAIAQVRSTMVRVKELLLQPDTRPCVSKPRDANHSVCLTKAYFAWENSQNDKDSSTSPAVILTKREPDENGKHNGETVALTTQSEPKLIETLHEMNLAVPKGQLVGICGPVGSGKSSLLSAILGQMHLLRGDLAFRGSMAYTPQQPWLTKATVRENIVFGDAFDPKRYYNAIRCCALNYDLHSLPAGDQTEVAEAGITLSGGQKQRLALARAVYSSRDVHLLDDPLAALDSVVAEFVFKQCIVGELATKTVLFVSSQLKFLQQCDHVVVMRDGRIVEQGTPAELMGTGGYYSSLTQEIVGPVETSVPMKLIEADGVIKTSKSPSPSEERSGSVDGSVTKECSVTHSLSSLATGAGQLTRPEERGRGEVSWRTYYEYVRAMGGLFVALGISFTVLLFVCIVVLASWYLGLVLKADLPQQFIVSISEVNASELVENENITDVLENDANNTHPVVGEIINITPLMEGTSSAIMGFGLILLGIVVTGVIQAYVFSKATMVASRRLHDRILKKVFKGSMRFFETTPVGRILNIFSKDLDEVDFMLATFLNVAASLVATCTLYLLMIAVVYPWFLLTMPVLGLLFVYVVLLFRTMAREVKRRENVSRSPLFSHVNATLTGLATLHAYEKEKLFEREFFRLQDDNSALIYLLNGSIRWLGFRLDFLVAFATAVLALLIVVLHGYVDSAFAALALIYCSMLAGTFNYTIRVTTETQARFTNVERLLRYEQSLENEGPDRKMIPPAPADWPTRGQISFDRVDLRYRENLPLALSGVTFSVRPGEKIAIVGRTGSGKSSLGAALFRLVKLSRGGVTVDNLDVCLLSLYDVRSRMSIIPQDPVLFKGTIRFNMDPLNQHHDEEIWQALDKIHLHEKISSMEKQLSFTVEEGGDNFSVGEKQLLCLARAVLRHSRVLFLDEATASVDDATNQLLHQVLMESFTECTILCIAHRLQHATDFDRVLVMEQGKVVEFDDPKTLAAQQSSAFSKLLAASNSC